MRDRSPHARTLFAFGPDAMVRSNRHLFEGGFFMANTRRTAGWKATAKKPAGGTTKAKVKRVARQAQAALEVAAHDAGLALRRTARKLKRTAQKLETKIAESKGPAKRTARRVERTVASALDSAGESITTAGRRVKLSFDAARKAFAEAPAAKKPAATKRTVKKSATRRKTAQ
jgi:hypothetical protein